MGSDEFRRHQVREEPGRRRQDGGGDGGRCLVGDFGTSLSLIRAREGRVWRPGGSTVGLFHGTRGSLGGNVCGPRRRSQPTPPPKPEVFSAVFREERKERAVSEKAETWK